MSVEIEPWTVEYNPCFPTLSVPPQLFSIDTLWPNCADGIKAFYDPPITLTRGSGLIVPAGPTTTKNPDPTLQPASVLSFVNSTPSATTTAGPSPKPTMADTQPAAGGGPTTVTPTEPTNQAQVTNILPGNSKSPSPTMI